jgi:hypothetical protein
VCRKTSIKLKSKITENLLNQKYRKIGGNEKVEQIDETAICRGRLILDPSNELDDVLGITWIECGVVEGQSQEVFVVIVPNRKMETITLYWENTLLKVVLYEQMVIQATFVLLENLEVYIK